MKKYIVIGIFSLVFFGVLQSTNVSALSSFDDVIQNTDFAYISNTTVGDNIFEYNIEQSKTLLVTAEFSNPYGTEVFTSINKQVYLSAFDIALESGSVGISYLQGGGATFNSLSCGGYPLWTGDTILYQFSIDPDSYLKFDTYSSTNLAYLVSPNNELVYTIAVSHLFCGSGHFVFGISGSLAVNGDMGATTAYTYGLASSFNGFRNQILVFNGNVQYPAGYSGIFPPTTAPNLIDSPIIDYRVLNDSGQFQAKDIPEDITKIHWLITYGSSEGEPQLQTFESQIPAVATEKLNFTFPHIAQDSEADVFGSYTIEAWYVDDNNSALSNETTIAVVLRSNFYNYFVGTCQADQCLNTPIDDSAISLDLGSQCQLSETFPFLNIDSCYLGMKNMIRIMTFDKFHIGNQLEFVDSDCRMLNTFDEWLHLPNNFEICPVFPKSIRDIITPFVMFLFALLTIKFISRDKSDEEN